MKCLPFSTLNVICETSGTGEYDFIFSIAAQPT